MSRWNQASLNREQVVLFSPTLDTPSVRRWRMRRLAKLTLEQKIRWLESAQEMVQRMQQSGQETKESSET